MKIGITVGLSQEYESLWVNGIKLNVLNLANTIKQIGEHQVWILDTSNKVKDLSKVAWDPNEFPVFKYTDKWKGLDLLIMLGTSLTTEMINSFKKENPNGKIVKYQCGNNYVIDMERVLFNTYHNGDNKALPSWDQGHDETWLIPQQEKHNLHYYRSNYNQNENTVKVVPFVWSSIFLERNNDVLKKLGKKTPDYIPGKKKIDKKLTAMEPNLNVLKYSMIPILIAENVFKRMGKDAYKQMYVAGGTKILKNEYFKHMIKNLEMVKHDPPKLKFVPRYPITTILAEETDIVLSHQWDNPLNYLYLDVLYFGHPLVHNAWMVQDAGYYYDEFKIFDGVDQLEWVLNHHDQHTEEYKIKNKKVLDRYESTNTEIVKIYKQLIENLWEPGKHELSYEYDWQTNTYK